jgi:hypothetical protein
MCKQCCISLSRLSAGSGCSLRAHSFDQLTSRQQSKLAAAAVPIPADYYFPPLDGYDTATQNAITTQDPVILFLDKEQQQLEDDEKEQYQAAVAASLSVPHTSHLISSTSSSRIPPESFTLSEPSPSLFPLASPHGSAMPPATPPSWPPTKPTTAVRTIPFQAPAPKTGPKEHMSEDWMRPVVDNTKNPKRRNRINLDNTFSLIFWHAVCLWFAFCVMYTNHFHRMESHRNGELFTSAHFGQSGSCQMLPMFARNLTFKTSSWSTLTHEAHNGSPAPPPTRTLSRRTVPSFSDF